VEDLCVPASDHPQTMRQEVQAVVKHPGQRALELLLGL
jgi:hypothetical protein